MKKLLLLAALASCHLSHAQTIKFKPAPEDWRTTATPQQMADTLKALEYRREKARQQVNLLSALSEIAAERADDSMKRLRAAQVKEWSKVPKPVKKAAPKKKVSPK